LPLASRIFSKLIILDTNYCKIAITLIVLRGWVLSEMACLQHLYGIVATADVIS